MTLLLDSALRSLLFGLFVWALLRLLRVRDSGTETIVWTTVLAVAIAMPLLSHLLPKLVVVVPRVSGSPAPSVAVTGFATASSGETAALWLDSYAPRLLVGTYVLGLLVCLARLIIGLALIVRLYRRSVPVVAPWTDGRRIRTAASLKSPATLGWFIVLPPDYPNWSATTREAILAHEEAHVSRGDFFVNVAATLHRAVFWFSPFAWWLQSKLAELAETASDEAAVRALNDRITYAEVLLHVARSAQSSPLIIAMAKSSCIEQRIDRILGGAPPQSLSPMLQVFALGALTLAAAIIASLTTAADLSYPTFVGDRSSPAQSLSSALSTSETRVRNLSAPARRRSPVPDPQAGAAANAPQRRDDVVSYNPRALLDPAYVPARSYLPASTIMHAGKIFYIHSTERPVAEVSGMDAKYRPAQ
jgi:beta-lactamase regulating signal transducer with metallopeptidase domain